MRNVRPIIVAAVLTGLAHVMSASAAAPAEPSSLSYEASPSCPSRAAFVAQVRASTTEWNESSSASRLFTVRLAAADDGRTRGSLVVAQGGKSGSARVVDGGTCAQTARALAFVTALAIDAYAMPPEPDAPPAPASAPPGAAKLDAQANASVTPQAGAVPVATKLDAAASASPPRAATDEGPRWSAGLATDLIGLAAPGPVAGVAVFVGVRPVRRLDLRLSLRQTVPSTVVAEGTSTSIMWTTGRLEPCFGGLLTTGRLEISPCVFVELGRLAAAGGGVDKTESGSLPWTAGGAAARAEIAIGELVRLDLETGLLVPFSGGEVAYRPALVVYRPPPVGGHVSLGAVARWR